MPKLEEFEKFSGCRQVRHNVRQIHLATLVIITKAANALYALVL